MGILHFLQYLWFDPSLAESGIATSARLRSNDQGVQQADQKKSKAPGVE